MRFRKYIWIIVGLLFLTSVMVPVEGQSLDNDIEVKVYSRLMLDGSFIVAVLASIFMSLGLAYKFRNKLGVVVGLLFLAYALVPLGGYQLVGADGVARILWHFMVPTGWYCLVVGVILLFHRRLGLENRRLAYVLFATGLFIIPLLFQQNIEYWLGLWSGVSGNFDIEAPRWLLTPFLVLAATGIFTSLLVWKKPITTTNRT